MVEDAEGASVCELHRRGKRIIWEFDRDQILYVFHLMIAGRFHLREGLANAKGKNQLAAFQFGDFTLLLTERSQMKRATLHVVRGLEGLSEHERDGIDVRECTREEFAQRLAKKNRTINRALTDPSLFDGIGNAYSDEILHAAGVSPLKWTSRLEDDEIARLYHSSQAVLTQWQHRLITDTGDAFPEKVTAFRPGMAVHGRFGEPCPTCGSPVQRIVYSANECNYCADCQTDGKVLADRSLSRLLKGDWPRTIEEWEEAND